MTAREHEVLSRHLDGFATRLAELRQEVTDHRATDPRTKPTTKPEEGRA